jgi:hypothetical protein
VAAMTEIQGDVLILQLSLIIVMLSVIARRMR